MQPQELRTVFMGTPDFALQTLQGLIDAGCKMVGVYTQPDRPKGRGKQLAVPPVKELAQKYDIPVYQPLKLRQSEAVAELEALAPDLIVVVAYGQILPKRVLEIPAHGCINVHASLLPKYRGAAPINKAIIDGETETGITTMYMDVGLDTGDMLVKKALSIGPEETAGELHDRLASLGRETMEETLRQLCAGTLQREVQDDEQSTYASLMKKEDGRIDWSRSAQEIHNHVRGLDPWPGAYTTINGELLKLAETSPEAAEGLPGNVIAADKNGVCVACGSGSLRIQQLQLAGRKRLAAADFLRGCPLEAGAMME
ncbi:MAG: methionyl-tRNA formyltransferase [Desulfuromonadales bacterium]|jgi:methionyl-tRNA formyltransferase|nr:methionyl-tRNA formyltransferase [Desulfuromonadales bacterium]